MNWIEVLSKIAQRGEDPELAAAEMKGAGLIGSVVTIEAVTEQDSIEIARLRPLTKKQGLHSQIVPVWHSQFALASLS